MARVPANSYPPGPRKSSGLSGSSGGSSWKKNPYNSYGPNDYLIVTQVLDQAGNKVVAPMVINSISKINQAFTNVNEIKSFYGKDGFKEYLPRYTNN